MKQEHKLESLNICINELQLALNDWIWRTPITDMLNLDKNKFDCKKNLLRKKKLFEKLKFEAFK